MLLPIDALLAPIIMACSSHNGLQPACFGLCAAAFSQHRLCCGCRCRGTRGGLVACWLHCMHLLWQTRVCWSLNVIISAIVG